MTVAQLEPARRRDLLSLSGGALRALLTLPAVAGSVLVLLIGLAWLGRYEVVGLAAWISAGLLTLTAPGEALLLRVRGIRALAPSEARALANCWNAALKDCRHDASRLQLRLSTETKVNAYAAGGRCVAVTQGALTEFLTGNLSREHLTAVLTHEIGHYQTNSTRLPLLADYFALPGRRLLHLAARLISAFVPRQPRLLLQTIAVSAVTMACISTANADHWAALTVLGGGSLAALVCPVADAAIARRLEFKADGVARQAGHGRALAELLHTFDQGPEFHRLLVRHPRIDRRVQRLEDALLDNEGQWHVRYPNVTIRRSQPVSTTSKCAPSQVRGPIRTAREGYSMNIISSPIGTDPTSSPIGTDPLHDVTSAAAYLRCGPRLIYRLVNERRIRYTKAGRCLRFRQSDLDRYLDTNAVEPSSKAS